jgi:hypothetical protein
MRTEIVLAVIVVAISVGALAFLALTSSDKYAYLIPVPRNVASGAQTTSTPMPTTTATDTPIPEVTPPAVTPTVPVTVTLHADWVPTTQPFFGHL